ncbi:hypothetical protein EC3006_4188, partial [Escherichia coli 3006]
SASVI